MDRETQSRGKHTAKLEAEVVKRLGKLFFSTGLIDRNNLTKHSPSKQKVVMNTKIYTFRNKFSNEIVNHILQKIMFKK